MQPQEVALSIDLNLREKLRDKEYRRHFFWAETSARIARDLINLRKRRGINQTELAGLIGTKQPAISRIEQADYENWNLGTLRAIADAEDARVRVIIEPAEDVLAEYDSGSDQAEHALPASTAEQADAAHPVIIAPETGANIILAGTIQGYPSRHVAEITFASGFGKTGAAVLGAAIIGTMNVDRPIVKAGLTILAISDQSAISNSVTGGTTLLRQGAEASLLMQQGPADNEPAV